jgi:hypothetical protein
MSQNESCRFREGCNKAREHEWLLGVVFNGIKPNQANTNKHLYDTPILKPQQHAATDNDQVVTLMRDVSWAAAGEPVL